MAWSRRPRWGKRKRAGESVGKGGIIGDVKGKGDGDGNGDCECEDQTKNDGESEDETERASTCLARVGSKRDKGAPSDMPMIA